MGAWQGQDGSYWTVTRPAPRLQAGVTIFAVAGNIIHYITIARD